TKDAERLTPNLSLEQGLDHPEDLGHEHARCYPLEYASNHQESCIWCKCGSQRCDSEGNQADHKHGLAIPLIPESSRRHQSNTKSQHIAGNDQTGLGRCSVKRFFQRSQNNVDLDHVKNRKNRYGSSYRKRDPRGTRCGKVLDSHQARLAYGYTLKQLSWIRRTKEHSMVLQQQPCPCGTTEDYGLCCGPLLAGEQTASTAEALMRSRYTAFVVGNDTYLAASWHSQTRPD